MAYLYKPAGSAHYISSKIFFIQFLFLFISRSSKKLFSFSSSYAVQVVEN